MSVDFVRAEKGIAATEEDNRTNLAMVREELTRAHCMVLDLFSSPSPSLVYLCDMLMQPFALVQIDESYSEPDHVSTIKLRQLDRIVDALANRQVCKFDGISGIRTVSS